MDCNLAQQAHVDFPCVDNSVSNFVVVRLCSYRLTRVKARLSTQRGRMGILNDLFMATTAEAASLSEDEIPIQRFPGVDVKGRGFSSSVSFMPF